MIIISILVKLNFVKNILKINTYFKKNVFKFFNSRRAFSKYEFLALIKAGWYFYFNRIDPLYQSKFENEYIKKFVDFMGGGFADAVNSGTSACFIALKSIELELNSNVAVSCFTDPGVINAVLTSGHKPVFIPFKGSNDWRYDIHSLEKLIKGKRIKALIYVHSFGDVLDIIDLQKICKKNNIFFIEDFSQCIGGVLNGQKVGTFSDISFSSTMGRKNLITGSVGGIVFTKKESFYYKILSYADRGKSINKNFQTNKDARLNENISLNFSSDEFLCAIGLSSLDRLDFINRKRRSILTKLKTLFKKYQIDTILELETFSSDSAPFVGILKIKCNDLKNRKEEFTKICIANELPINFEYVQISPLWPWLKKYYFDQDLFEKSILWKENHFIFYIHEGYQDYYLSYIVAKLSDIFDCMQIYRQNG